MRWTGKRAGESRIATDGVSGAAKTKSICLSPGLPAEKHSKSHFRSLLSGARSLTTVMRES
jgi:hypothetical protein